MIKVVLFDIDGTLIRTGGAGVKAFEKTFREEFGLKNATQTLKFAGRTDTSLVRETFLLHGIPATVNNFERFFRRYPTFLEPLLKQLPGGPCEGVVELLAHLNTQNPKPVIGLLTGNVRRGAELKLAHYQLWHHFAFGGFGDDHEDRNCIAAVARERGEKMAGRTLLSEEILVIGDTPLDVACGKSIGAKVLAVATGNYSVAELMEAQPTLAVDHLAKPEVRRILNGG